MPAVEGAPVPRFRIACTIAVVLSLLAPTAEAAQVLNVAAVEGRRPLSWSAPWVPDPGRHRGRTIASDVPVPHREPAYRPPEGAAATGGERSKEPTAASDRLGLERFRQYAQVPVGAGASLMVEGSTGNTVLGWNLLANPALGPAAFLRLTYNSLDPEAGGPAGPGWSVATSTLSRLGSRLVFGPDERGGQGLPRTVRLIDGDGTGHVFRLRRHGSKDPAAWDYAHPPGVHLFLQRTGSRDKGRTWSFTRPDRTQFFYGADGRPATVVDRNGNTLRFEYDDHGSGLLHRVVDASGRTVLALDHLRAGRRYDYLARDGDRSLRRGRVAAGSRYEGRLASVTDVSGRRVTFIYDARGNLARITDAAGTNAERSLDIGYVTGPGGRPRLDHVADPLGHRTHLSYPSSPGRADGSRRVQSITDRRGGATGFHWAGAKSGTVMTVTDSAGHRTAYTVDDLGRPVRARDAKGGTTRLTWDDDHNVTELREANGARTTWEYDHATGYPLTVTDPVANAGDRASTSLSYRTALGGHVADLVEKVSPEGRRWTFGHDAYGNLIRLTDPRGYTSRNVYDSAGRLMESVDARGGSTRFADFDPTGSPRRIIDALGHTTSFRYDAVGNVLSVTDANKHTSTHTYDVRKRPLESRQPIDQAAGRYVVTPPPVYDRNDNVLRSTAPNGAVTTAAYDAGDLLVSLTEPKDRSQDPARVSTYAYDPVGNLVRSTTPKGTLTAEPDDFTTYSVYDEVNQLVEQRDALGGRATFRYDAVGNVIEVFDPRTNAGQGWRGPTSRAVYDLGHRVIAVTDPAGATERRVYDHDGLVTRVIDALGSETLTTYDALGKPVEVKVPHRRMDDGTVEHRTTRYTYDEVGNRTKVYSPRAVAEDKESLADVSVFDAVGRLVERRLPHDPLHPRVRKPDILTYAYDPVGRLTKTTTPASQGSPGSPNSHVTAYFDNGWVRSSTDPWNIRTSYDYDPVGNQTSRTLTGDGDSTRFMRWQYTLDGRVLSRTDQGTPAGSDTVLVDDADLDRTTATGTWEPVPASGWGDRHLRHAAGTGSDTVTWTTQIPTKGAYEVFAHVPAGATAENAAYTVEHDKGTARVTVDQRKAAGSWKSLGRWTFEDETTRRITLTDEADAPVLADAIRLVRDNPGVEKDRKAFTYAYDPDGNLTSVQDASPGAATAKYTVTYDGINRPRTIDEYAAKPDTDARHTTTYAYDPNGNITERTYDTEKATYTYDERELLRTSVTEPEPGQGKATTTTFTWDLIGRLEQQVKDNGNVLRHAYYLDGLQQKTEELKSGGTLVARHELQYDPNGNRSRDIARTMSADDHGDYLDVTSRFTYDPRDRIEKVIKTDGGRERTELYEHDGNNNVVRQTVERRTDLTYDRDRLVTASTAGVTASYHYDPYGRLSRITQAGHQAEKYVYDGFDRVIEHHAPTGIGHQTSRTTYAYDPLDRRVTTTAKGRTTTTHYLGLTDQVLTEVRAGKIHARYEYGPDGQRLSQTRPKSETDDTRETTFFGYGPHTDVETLTDESGNTKATYGYTAYGQDDEKSFTGIDKPDATHPDKEPYNAYRFNAKRWDGGSKTYDMGFRDYSPGLNQFLSRDMYNGALADLRLATDPWTANRYAFAGGNPVSNVELDGHDFFDFLEDVGEVALDTLELAADVAEGVLGAAAVVGGGLLIAGGAAACGLSVPLLATGVGVPVTAGSCAAGAGGAAAGVGLAGLGFGMVMHGGSEFGSDLNRMLSESGGGSPGSPDPHFERLRPAERETLQRAQQKYPDLNLKAAADERDGEYIDSLGRTYDQIGNPEASKFWERPGAPQKFYRSIDGHLNKSMDFTLIDLTGFSEKSKSDIAGYVDALPPSLREKIVRIGF
ncbi:RHS repeat-associated core domain-containing protein [Streptomyces sp. NPDC127114]|uniref:golvesin C-terminal-like domain-containing protein n=1 Tax=Streptomyces sp. NPDC127114 TaxID=3345366 RepID=UPI00362BC1ED